MPLQKILLKPGVNRENTRYTNEGGWYESDKIRFRQGNPETIGGWVPTSLATFKGICRSLWNWATLGSVNLTSIGTNLKFYIAQGGAFYDITPIRTTATLGTNPFMGAGNKVVTVTHTSHGAANGDFVTFSGVTGTYAAQLNGEFQITLINANSYTITTTVDIAAGATGGSAVVAAYQLNTSLSYAITTTGWGAGGYGGFGGGSWGIDPPPGPSTTTNTTAGLWSAQNYGQDLVFGPRGGGVYYWAYNSGTSTRGQALNTMGGTVTFSAPSSSPVVATFSNVLTAATKVQFSVSAGGTLPNGLTANTTYQLFNVNGVQANLLTTAGLPVSISSAGSGTFSVSLLVDVPTVQNVLTVSDTSRFVFALGCNDYDSTTQDKMLVRWSDQNNPYVWSPDATNQAGSIRLSHGSEIVAGLQTRQEQVVITDSSVYVLQYLGPPVVWNTQLVGDNITIASQNAAILASGVVYWMGVDKFYVYDGRVQTLNCDLRKFVFNNFNEDQRQQVYAGTNDGFNEVWWFYPSLDSTYCDRYVVYNYLEKVWYYGTMRRSAWLDSGLLPWPIATTYDTATQTGRLINHETGVNDNTDGTEYPLNAYIASSEFDIQDGDHFSFVWRMLPDLTFNNSTPSPSGEPAKLTLTLQGLNNSGSGINAAAGAAVSKTVATVTADRYTGQIDTRIRARQLVLRIESNQVNTSWQLGAPRIDIRPDGRKT